MKFQSVTCKMLLGDFRLGVEAPKVEVRFEELSVETEATVRKRVLPTLPNAVINTAQVDLPPCSSKTNTCS